MIMARGQVEFTAGNSIKMILLLVMAIGFTLLISSQEGGIRKIMEGVCEKHADILPFCQKPQIETIQAATARRSVDALVCAMNSVAAGEMTCDPVFHAEDSKPLESDYIVEHKETKATFRVNDEECKDKNGKGICYDEFCEGLPGCEIEDGLINTEGRNTCMCSVRMPTTSTVNCEIVDGVYTCRVTNFHLPQEVSTIEAITVLGDPEIVTYFEKFPIEGDTWTIDKVNWGRFVLIGAISVVPFFKVAKLVTGKLAYTFGQQIIRMTGKEIIKEGAERVVKKVASKAVIRRAAIRLIRDAMNKGTIRNRIAGKAAIRNVPTALDDKLLKNIEKEVLKDFGGKWENVITEQDIVEVTRRYTNAATFETIKASNAAGFSPESLTKMEAKVTAKASVEAQKELAKHGLMAETRDAIKKRVLGKDYMKTMKRFGFLTGVTFAAAVADSMMKMRFNEYDDTIVYKEILKEPVQIALDEASGKMVLIDLIRAKSWGDKIMRFHLVSPCHLSYVDVKKAPVECEDYHIIIDDEGNEDGTCSGKIKVKASGQDRGKICDTDSYDAGDFGPLEFLEELDAIPEHLSVVYNGDEPLDKGKFAYPVLEYDAGWLGPATNDVFYRYKDGSWKWKSPDADANEYESIPTLATESDWENFRDTYKISTVHKDIMRNLTSDFNAGMIGLKDIMSKDDDSSGTNIKNDVIYAHLYKGQVTEITHDTPDKLLNLDKISTEMEKGYYIFPISKNVNVYYNPQTEYIKMAKITGSELDTIELLAYRHGTYFLEGKYFPDEYIEGVETIHKEQAGTTVSASGLSPGVGVTLPDVVSGMYNPDISITVKLDGQKNLVAYMKIYYSGWETEENESAVCIRVGASSSSPTVKISDSGDDYTGTTRSIGFYDGTLKKEMVSSDPLEQGDPDPDFEEYLLKDCIDEDAIVVELADTKIGSDENYCTMGLTKWERTVDMGGDVIMVGGAVASIVLAPFTLGGSVAGWVPWLVGASSSIAELGTEIYGDISRDWPNSW